METICNHCNGKGYVIIVSENEETIPDEKVVCLECEGTGMNKEFLVK